MNTTVEFIDTFVKIEKMENGDFGFYPFHLVAEHSGRTDCNALMLGGDIAACYRRFRSYHETGTNNIHMAVDFPAVGDIKQDFVAVFCYQRGLVSVLAIPYDVKTGEVGEYIKTGEALARIEEDFRKIALM